MSISWGTMKALLRKGLADAWYFSNLYHIRNKGKVAILTYHRVLSRHELDKYWVQPGMYVEAGVFEQQMQFLQEHFQILSFQDLLARWRNRDWDDTQRYCVITFDDGWLDNYLHAYPVLKKYGIPATIFLPTNFIGTNEWFWPEQVSYLVKECMSREFDPSQRLMGEGLFKRFMNIDETRTLAAHRSQDSQQIFADSVIEQCKTLSHETIIQFVDALASELSTALPRERLLMNWDEVALMSKEGISFGSHSCSHRILTKLPLNEVKVELEASQQVLQDRSRNYVPVFCYPNGNTNAYIQGLVKECGYQAATGVQPGMEGGRPDNLFEIRRLSIHNDVTCTVPLYAMRLSGPMVA